MGRFDENKDCKEEKEHFWGEMGLT